MAEAVYFIQSGERGPIKIGTSKDVARRLFHLQAGNPVPLHLLATVPGGVDLEAELHFRFAPGAMGREWFRRETPGLLELVGYAFEHGQMPAPPREDPPVACDTCGWPQEPELFDQGHRACWACLRDRSGWAKTESTDLQAIPVVYGDGGNRTHAPFRALDGLENTRTPGLIPLKAGLDGPSRTIIVEPVEQPAPVEPERLPEPAPEPEREPEKVPG